MAEVRGTTTKKLRKRTPIEHPSDDFPTVIAGRSPVRVIEPIEVRSPVLDPVSTFYSDRKLIELANDQQREQEDTKIREAIGDNLVNVPQVLPNTPPPSVLNPAQEIESKMVGVEDLLSDIEGRDADLGESLSGAISGLKNDLSELFGGLKDSFGEFVDFQKKGGVLGAFLHEVKFGMNDEAKAEFTRLQQLGGPEWLNMTEEERFHKARQPQMDAQLPHAFIDGHPTTDVQKQIAALTGGKAPGSTVYNADGSVNIQATAQGVTGSGEGQGGAQAPDAPKWWEPGYVPPGGGQPPVGGFPPSQPPIYGGGQPVPGLPAYLQRELAPTPDFTGSFQPSLLGNTTLPSQQITGLLAPQQPQQQQLNPQLLAGLLGGLV